MQTGCVRLLSVCCATPMLKTQSVSLKIIGNIQHHHHFVSHRTYSVKKKMPVFTAAAVAAHRQNHHYASCTDSALPPEMLTRRYRLLSCGSVDVPFNPVFRTCGLEDKGVKSTFPWNVWSRGYAKGKDKPKSKKSVVVINEEEMKEVVDADYLKKQMEKLVEQMKEEYSKQLSVRGAAGALETLTVDFEGEQYPLQELAQVGRKNPQLAVLNLASLPDAIQPVLKAIRESGMNLNPQQEGTTIYVALPKVTREHRENLAKNAKTIFNKYKINFQAVQNKFIKQAKAQKDISEDLSFRVQQQIMKLSESYVTEAEKLMHSKQTELLENK